MTETTLEIELWLSFVSLLRSYVAAANLNLREHAVVEEAGDTVSILAGATRLVMRFNAGKVIWEKTGTQAAVGSFEFLPEGRIAIGGNVQDLDHVAIEFIDLLTRQRSVSGHGFSRAEKAPQKNGALAPDGTPAEKGGDKP